MTLLNGRGGPRMTTKPTFAGRVDTKEDGLLNYVLDADSTRYSVVVCDTIDGPLVLAQWSKRAWHVFGKGSDVIAQSYVAEKFGVEPESADAVNLTVLIATALDRSALIIHDGEVESVPRPSASY